MTEQWSVFRGHFFMCLKRCNIPRIFMAGMVNLSVWTLGMLCISWHQRSTYAEARVHRKMATSDFRQTSQGVEMQTAESLIKDFMSTTTMGSTEADGTNKASVQKNTAELLGHGITGSKKETKKVSPKPKVRVLKRKKTATPGAGTNEARTKRSCSRRDGSEQRWCFNSTEVQNMRQHILKFYNPETNLTLTQSSVRIGQRLTYEIQLSKKVTATKDLLKLLPEESPLKDRHFNTCAIVGNSGILLNSSCGQEIDSMDFVIRCNLPQIEGYEKDVGSKANLTTMNPSVIPHDFGKDYRRLSRRLKQVGDQILYVPGLTSPSGEMHVRIITQIVLQHKLAAKITFPPAGMNTLMKSIWSNAGFETLRPSTGAHMYTLAATICDQIHMYGFYPFSEDTRGRALGYHYYDTKEMISNRTHNMPEEFRAFQQLHMRGALVLHTEPCQ
ncbi:CMP-N-acetylneuraminate-poly-alpha-2,8-sialyltransferase-like [Branchiostoma floridae]|uniref:CMP-N-acetylneuraminate-poly-alpha-2, 8-sialyltransferase-like n=1 Tax=Branchiostoma floridae TaxID=7739 RepID=A0A9J7LAX4_BRAFL|nr:CMP-N-acetylneuraminate-poly-alpha-2,8-sialyltransferase-like [Branchiostoma floridae]